MILPTKTINLRNSFVGIGAQVVALCREPIPVVALWEKVRDEKIVSSFEQFTLVLDFLFTTRVIELRGKMLTLKNNA